MKTITICSSNRFAEEVKDFAEKLRQLGVRVLVPHYFRAHHGSLDEITDHTFTVLSAPRLMPGHTLVIPKRHAEKLSELSKDERNELFDEAIRIEENFLWEVAPGCDLAQHYRPFIKQNDLKVNHLRIHLQPRYLDDNLHRSVQTHERGVFAPLLSKECEKYGKLFSA